MSETALTTLAEVKAQGAAGDDDLLKRMIVVASEAVEDFLLRPLLYRSEVREFPGLGGRGDIVDESLYLRHYPIVEVAEVVIGGVAQTVADVTPEVLPLVDNAARIWLSADWLKTGKLVRFAGWPQGHVAVTYSGGYAGPNQCYASPSAPPLPAVIGQAALMTTLRLASIASRGGELDLVAEVTAGGWEQRWGSGSSSRASLVPDAAKMLIRKYRRKWIR